MMSFLVFVAACTGSYYLVARAEITRWWWETILQEKPTGFFGPFHSFLNRLFSCAACSGFWLGLSFWQLASPLIPASVTSWWLRWALGGIYGLLLTPAGLAVFYRAMYYAQPVATKVEVYNRFTTTLAEKWPELEAMILSVVGNRIGEPSERGPNVVDLYPGTGPDDHPA
jgi:hypothetical protein